MNLTEKGRIAFNLAYKFYPQGKFSAADLSKISGEKVSAAALNGIVTKGYMTKEAGSPVKFSFVSDIDNLIAADEAENVGVDNTKLNAAKKAKKDEFYTQFEDVEKEVIQYKKYFRNKRVLLNCNDGRESAFWKFFIKNFDAFQLRTLTAISYNPKGRGHVLTVDTDKDLNYDGFIDENDIVEYDLEGNGAFHSEECLKILEKNDIICTNPPFSLFRDFLRTLITYKKSFLILGNNNAITYKEVFSLLKNNEMWLGYHSNKTCAFQMPDDYSSDTIIEGKKIGKVPAISWFTNLPTKRRNEPLILTKTYNSADYPKYDNYDAIEVSKVINIPKDYFDIMGVPITFMDKYCPEQFEILGCTAFSDVNFYGVGEKYIKGQKKYARILIRRKKQS